jgi:hypothetical protein
MAGGKLNGFFKKSEKLSWERSKSGLGASPFSDLSSFFFFDTFYVLSTDFLDLLSALSSLDFLDLVSLGGFSTFSLSFYFDLLLLLGFFSLISKYNAEE